MTTEIAKWISWDQIDRDLLPSGRVYVGCETCENMLPGIDWMITMLKKIMDKNQEVTLVTPFVTERGLEKLETAFDRFSGIGKSIEVVCNDWGVFETVRKNKFTKPVIGRLLSGQSTDPRFYSISDEKVQKIGEKRIRLVDGTEANLTYQPPTDELIHHLNSPAIMNTIVLDYLSSKGVSRFEVSNLLQGIEIKIPEKWHVTLYLPKVIIAVRRCREFSSRNCGFRCNIQYEPIDLPDFPVPIFISASEVYYQNDKRMMLIDNIGIDRIVIQSFD